METIKFKKLIKAKNADANTTFSQNKFVSMCNKNKIKSKVIKCVVIYACELWVSYGSLKQIEHRLFIC